MKPSQKTPPRKSTPQNPSKQTANFFSTAQGQKRGLEPLCADDFSMVPLMFQLLLRHLDVCHSCASLYMLKREEATRWLMLPCEHVSLTARSNLRELHRGAIPQTRAVKEGCEASAGTHVLVGWEAQHTSARKAVAEPTGQSKRLWMVFRICSPACLTAGC